MIYRFFTVLVLSLGCFSALNAANMVTMPLGRLQLELNKNQGALASAQFSNAQGISDVESALHSKIKNGTLTLDARWTAQTLGVQPPQADPGAQSVMSKGTLTISVSVGNSVYQAVVTEGTAVTLTNIK